MKGAGRLAARNAFDERTAAAIGYVVTDPHADLAMLLVRSQKQTVQFAAGERTVEIDAVTHVGTRQLGHRHLAEASALLTDRAFDESLVNKHLDDRKFRILTYIDAQCRRLRFRVDDDQPCPIALTHRDGIFRRVEQRIDRSVDQRSALAAQRLEPLAFDPIQPLHHASL